MCLSAKTIILFNRTTVQKSGEEFAILNRSSIYGLNDQVYLQSGYAGYDFIESICLAAYMLAKGHYFMEGNKRTATYVLLNCLRKNNRSYTGRPIDLARKIEQIAQTHSQIKHQVTLELAYFLRARLQ